MSELPQGEMELACPPLSAGEAREFFGRKSREQIDKRMSVTEAVEKFVHDGDYVGIGGFGHVRVPMVLICEIVRRNRRNLRIAGHTACHDLDFLMAGGCVSHVDVAYSFGHELRPIRTRVAGRLIKAGKLTTQEWSNASFSWRYKAAAMGVSFAPVKVMLGTDTFKYSGAKTIRCPFTGELYCALPALYPDVVLMHVSRADKYGNCQIEGITIADKDIARAGKHVIVSAEEIIDNSEIRESPHLTMIPYFCVDAVVHQPYGSHPCEMPGSYWFDEEVIAEYLKATQTEEDTAAYVKKYVYDVKDFNEYLQLVGGEEKMRYLERIEHFQEKPPYPW